MAEIEHNMNQPIIQESLPPHANNVLPLKGFKVRLGCGICITLMGIFEVIITSILLRLNNGYTVCEYMDRLSWGIWAGVFAIIAGCFGGFSSRSKCVVVTFMVLGIITAVISGGGVIFYASQANCITRETFYSDYYFYDPSSRRVEAYGTHLILYVLLCLASALQLLISIIGTSFTCVALCPSNNDHVQQVIMCQPSQLPTQPTGGPCVYPTVITRGQVLTSQSYGQSVPPPYSVIATQE